MNVKQMLALFALVAIAIPGVGFVNASVVEDTLEDASGTEEGCYQNDGTFDDADECDVSDTCEDADRYAVTTEGGRTKGAMAPVDDEHDFFLADLESYIGLRIRFDLAPVAFRAEIEMDTTTCEQLAASNTGSEGGGDGSSSAAEGEAPPELHQIYSGIRPFQPINVAYVLMDGTAVMEHSASVEGVTLQFDVINKPKALTFRGEVQTLNPGEEVFLCDFTGDLFVSSSDGGNLKFDGVASSYQVVSDGSAFAPCRTPPPPEPEPECGENFCEITVTEELSTLVVGLHFVEFVEPQDTSFSVPLACHDACLGGTEPLPVPGEYDLGFTLLGDGEEEEGEEETSP